MRNRGRPKAIIDWEQVGQMLMAGCSGVQSAAALGIDITTLSKHCVDENNMNISDFTKLKRAKGDAYLLAAQYNLALKDKNPTMLIWLGKQRLEQRDKRDLAIEGEIDIRIGFATLEKDGE